MSISACVTPVASSAATQARAMRREAHQHAGQQATALARLEPARRAREHEEQHDQAADPDTHRGDVDDVERQQGSDGVQRGRVARQRGGDQQEPGRQGKRGQDARGGGRCRRDARRPDGGRAQHGQRLRVLAPASSTPPSSSHAMTRSPQIVPKRVPRTSRTTVASSADQKVVPDAVAPCSTMPTTPEKMPRPTASNSSRRARAAKTAEASGQPRARAGRVGERGAPRGQQEGQPADAQRDGEVVQSAGDTERRSRSPLRRWSRPAGRRPSPPTPSPALPMLKTTPPETGWLSAEITR